MAELNGVRTALLFIDDEAAVRGGPSALATMRPLAKFAAETDRRRLATAEIEPARVDEAVCVARLAAERDRVLGADAAVGLRVGAHGAGDRHVFCAVLHLDELAQDLPRALERLVQRPKRAVAAVARKGKAPCGEALGDVAGAVDADEEEGNASRAGALQRGQPMRDLLQPRAEPRLQQVEVVAGRLAGRMEAAVGHHQGGGEIIGEVLDEQPLRGRIGHPGTRDDRVDFPAAFGKR